MKKLFVIMAFLLGLSSIFAVTLQHVAPNAFEFGQDVPLMVEILQGLDDIAEIKLKYHSEGQEPWYSELAKQESQGGVYYRVSIPAKYLSSEAIEYYFEVKLKHGVVENFPALDSGLPKYRISSAALEGEASPGFVLLTDEPSVSADDGYLLAVSFFALEGDIDPASLEVWVSGKNVTSMSVISGPTILYKDSKPQPGIKKAVVRAILGTKSIHSDIWITEVLPGSGHFKLPFEYRGSVNFASNHYSYSDSQNAPGAADSDAATWADLYGRYGIADFQTSLYLSSLEKSNLQPVNRYTLGVKIPHLEIYAGDYSPSLSQYTLNGKNIRGLYSRVYGKHAALTITSGQSVRKTTNDTDISDLPDIQKAGTFQQEAIGIRLQLGNEDGFMMGLNASRHRDIVSSLDSLYYQYRIPATSAFEPDQIIYTTPAKDNAVMSFDMRINIPEQNSVLGAEVAGSLLNKNTIPGPIDQNTLEDYTGQDIPINPSEYSNLFVFNKNMEPYTFSRANLAWLMYFRSYFWNNFINVQYSQTGSAFNALGAQYQMNDSRMVSISDQMNVHPYIVLNSGFNFSADNLMGHKSETNTNSSWFAQAVLRLPRAPYLKAAVYNNSGENEANPDVTAASAFEPYLRNSQNISFGIGYNIKQIAFVPTQLDISYRMGADDSQKTDTLEVVNVFTDNESSGLNFSMHNRFSTLPLTTQVSLAINTNKANLLNTENKNSVFFLGAAYSLWQNRIKPYANLRLVSLSGDQGDQSYSYLTLGAEANPLTNTTVSTDLGFQNHNSNLSNADYGTFVWRVLLSQRF